MSECRPGWTRTRVGDLFEMQIGKKLTKESSAGSEQFEYVTNKDVHWNQIRFKVLNRMSFNVAERERFRLAPGDLLVTEGGEVGRTAIWEGQRSDCYFQMSLHRLRTRGAVEPRFMLHYMAYAARHELFANGVSGTNIFHLPQDKFAEQVVSHPIDLAEQRRIVEVIDSLDEKERVIRASVAKLDKLSAGIMAELDCLERGAFEEVLDHGPRSGLYKPASSYGPEGTPIVRIDSFKGGPSDLTRNLLRVSLERGEIDRYGLSVGDILINRVNTPDLVGKSTAVGNLMEPTVFESNMMRCKVRADRAVPVFVETWLGGPVARGHFRTRAKSAISQASINGSDVRSCPFPRLDVPGQVEFLGRLAAVSDQRRLDVAELLKLRNLKQGIVDDLLDCGIKS